jgi:hypothetical protein
MPIVSAKGNTFSPKFTPSRDNDASGSELELRDRDSNPNFRFQRPASYR